jgi:hypothetical protein
MVPKYLTHIYKSAMKERNLSHISLNVCVLSNTKFQTRRKYYSSVCAVGIFAAIYSSDGKSYSLSFSRISSIIPLPLQLDIYNATVSFYS